MTKQRRWILLIAIYGILLGSGWLAGQWLPEFSDLNVSPANEPVIHKAIMTTAAIFILASALPFVPGAEIGFGLIMLFGGKIAFLVYICMFSALGLAFMSGRFLPLTVIASAFSRLGFVRAYEFLMQLAPLQAEERLALLTDNAPRRFGSALLRHRYIALIVLLNMPGNSIVGGGGGIAFVAGLSGLFSCTGFFMAIAIAIAPVPLFFLMIQ